MNNLRLLVKLRSLALEAKEIRRIERRHQRALNKANRRIEEKARRANRGKAVDAEDRVVPIFYKPHANYVDVYKHRLLVVRPETRCSNIAYGFFRGNEYTQIENRRHEYPDWDRIANIVKKFSDGDEKILADFVGWLLKAKQQPLISDIVPVDTQTAS